MPSPIELIDDVGLYLCGFDPSGSNGFLLQDDSFLLTQGGDNLLLQGGEILGEICVGIDLFLDCDPAGSPSDGMNLVVQAEDVPWNHSSLDLFLWSTSVTGIIGGVPLFVSSDSWPNAQMNLFVQAADSAATSAQMNMVTSGAYAWASAGLELFVANTQTIIEKGLRLFVKGDGQFVGALPTSDAMNLYIERGPNQAIDLFILGSAPTIGSIPLVVTGANPLEQGLELVMPNVIDAKTAGLRLFVRGF